MSTVYVVDDDQGVRVALGRLLRLTGHAVQVFASAQEFLAGWDGGSGCLVLDIRMPGMSGLELQSLAELPIVFISGHGTIRMSVQAMKQGAVDFITKPFDEDELLQAVSRALVQDSERRAAELRNAATEELVGSLTGREHEVFDLVVAGLSNKQVGARLGISEKTVKVHRGRVMAKLRVDSLAELVSLAHSRR